METTFNPTSLDRRRHRVRIDTPVRILPPGQQCTLVGSVQNLNEAGMFIRVDPPCPVGAELVCDVCLPAPHQTLPVRGRVVWVEQEPDPGMGIEFIDLAEADHALLQRVMQACGTGQVKAWLETLTHPIRATVLPSDDGVVLRAPLPFLRRLSSVMVYPVDEPDTSFSATLDGVTLQAGEGPVPELRLHLSLEPPAAAQPAEPERHAPPPRIITPISKPGPARSEATPESQLLDVQEQPFTLETVDPCEQSQWTLDSGQVAAALQASPSRAGNAWLWLAALAMVSITLASMVYTKSWTRAWSWARAHLAAPPPVRPTIVPLERPTPTRAPAAKPAHSSDETNSPAPPANPEPPRVRQQPLTAVAPFVDLPQPVAKPRVVESGGEPRLVVPIAGSTKDAVHYRLANPDGLVINLPHAQPRTKFGTFPLRHPPFRVVWLRRRQGGLHLRVLFSGKLPAYRLKMDSEKIQVVLERDEPEPDE